MDFPYGKFTKEAMRKGIDLVLNGTSVRNAAKTCGLAFQTLARYVKKFKNDSETKLRPNYNVNMIFTESEEKILAEYIINCSKMFYGLPIVECRKVAYEMAVINKKKIPVCWHKEEMAGRHWFANFRKRHPTLALRTPEGCSLSRATSFNQHNVALFFKNLKDVYSRSSTCFKNGSRIYNLDETSTMTVQKPQKVIAEKGIKQVSKVTSAERGTLVTTCCIISATGQYIPPVMVFPRTHFKDHMLTGAPAGTLGLANPSGWTNSESFYKVIDHFINYNLSSKTDPTVLIMDNHESHLNLAALNLAKENGVIILTVPPHSTNKLQPLDVGIYKPFKTAYNVSVDNYLMQNPGKTFNIYNVASSVGFAFEKSMTPANIISSFKKTGIFPFDENIFTEVDFMCSYVTDREMRNSTENNPSPVVQRNNSMDVEPLIGSPISTAVISVTEGSPSFIDPEHFRGYPKAGQRTNKRVGRKKGKSIIATDTPEKDIIEQNQLIQQKKPKKKLFQTKKKRAKKETGFEQFIYFFLRMPYRA